jgi:hypothetical protein
MRRLSQYLSYFNDDHALYLKHVIDTADLSKMFTFPNLADMKQDIATNIKLVNLTSENRERTLIDENFVEKIYSKNLKDFFPNKFGDEKQAISFIANLYEFAFINNLNNVITALDKSVQQIEKVKNPLITHFQQLKTIEDTNKLIDMVVDGIKNKKNMEINFAARIIANHEIFPIEDIQRIFNYKSLSLINFAAIDTNGLFNKSADVGDHFMMSVIIDRLPIEKRTEIFSQVIQNSDYDFFNAIVENSQNTTQFKKHLKELSDHFTNSGQPDFLDKLIDKGVLNNGEIKQLPTTYLKSRGYKIPEENLSPIYNR